MTAEGSAEGPADDGPAPTEQAVPARRPRARRRATAPQTGAGRDGTVPVLPGRSVDDTDAGWGERPADDEDERFLRDVPPHW